ncbi:tRNA lysidine(34) synthetase TilS [Finegoldia magna]|uniref:tRNA(Ile)-lysidine synthase n=1 Tax=Finegoldia magna (strain ATCC 29328 / DSM 20472 / WAL 2508) TaxID=334413 RepID=B0S224_FINM2|nr:tRNA lysidine(34) synthetase TilS [Finegoldia magna]UEA70232.1 tRNA lysidine(34) synthetase TilS [Finegoldia magna]BAG08414.1 cell cycle protein [Finegoldia magna ATCC 29328]
MDLIHKIKNTIIRENLIEKHDKILIGLSGGADSVFLLNILIKLQRDLDFEIYTCHINHSYRDTALRDENFSRKISEENNIKFFSKKVDMKQYSIDNSISLEDSGRILRYKYFNEILKSEDFNKIAVAHHLDDQVETFFLHLFRGSGIDGLCGIQYQNKNIIRPLLDVSKSEILNYLDENDIDYVTDETNFVADVQRNKIRLEMLPYIQDNFNSSISDSIYRTINILKDSKEIIDDVTNFKYKKLVNQENGEYFIDVNLFVREKKSVRRNIIRKLLIELNGSNQDIRMVYIDDTIELFDLKNGSQYVFKDYSFFKSYDKVIIRKNLNNKKNQSVKFELGEISFGDFKINSYLTENTNVKPSINKMIFDSKILSNNLFLRKRKNGDRIKLKGFTKKVKSVFIDNKIAQIKRDNYPILSDEENVYAILSLKRSNLYMKNDNSKEVLVIEVTYEK